MVEERGWAVFLCFSLPWCFHSCWGSALSMVPTGESPCSMGPHGVELHNVFPSSCTFWRWERWCWFPLMLVPRCLVISCWFLFPAHISINNPFIKDLGHLSGIPFAFRPMIGYTQPKCERHGKSLSSPGSSYLFTETESERMAGPQRGPGLSVHI